MVFVVDQSGPTQPSLQREAISSFSAQSRPSHDVQLVPSFLTAYLPFSLSLSLFQPSAMVILNPTRRMAILFAFIPMIALYLIYNFKLHLFINSISTWPTQRQIVTEISTFARHKLFPWTITEDAEREAADEAAAQLELSGRVPFTRHIVAVGDLHGDLPNARRVLRFANVIDDFGDWSGEVDFFVQTGDIIDRCVLIISSYSYHVNSAATFSGDDTIMLFIWMDKLREQASAVGDTVLTHLGNHEWMNAIGTNIALHDLDISLICILLHRR